MLTATAFNNQGLIAARFFLGATEATIARNLFATASSSRELLSLESSVGWLPMVLVMCKSSLHVR